MPAAENSVLLRGSTLCCLPTPSFGNNQLLLIRRERTFRHRLGQGSVKPDSHSAVCRSHSAFPSVHTDSVFFEILDHKPSPSLTGNWAYNNIMFYNSHYCFVSLSVGCLPTVEIDAISHIFKPQTK